MESKVNSHSISLLLALGLATVLAVMALSSYRPRSSGPVESVVIGTPPLESSALIFIAERQGFFAGSGLSVTTRQYNTGAASVTGLLNSEVDIAVPAEYALVGKAFQKEEVASIASIDKVQYFYLIARKDRGIESISDLGGKKIGVVTKTIAEFYLGRFLEIHGMHVDEVNLENIDLTRSEDVIMNGDVDAIISRPPYVSGIEKRLGENAVTWPAQSSQSLFAILIGNKGWINARPVAISRVLRALLQAEEYVIRYPAEARSIVRERLNVDDEYVANVWPENQFSLSLDQSLIVAMEDEARWMIKNNLTTEKQIPDFLNHVHVDGLKAAKPWAVQIIQ